MNANASRWLRYMIAVASHYGGPDLLYRWITGAGLVVLMLHRVRDEPDPFPLSISRSSLEQLLAWLHERDALTSLDDGLHALRRGSDGGPVRYAITLDDGYHDNLHLLSRKLRNMPAVIYVATSHVGRDPIWAYRLVHAVRSRRRDQLDLAELGLGWFDLSDPGERDRLFAVLPPRLKRFPAWQVDSWVDAIGDRLEARPGPVIPEMLDWDEVRQLHSRGIQIGGHTHHHAMLSRLDDAAAEVEITTSQRAIAGEVGVPPRHFAYPNGGHGDFGPRDVDLVRRAGFMTAVTTIEGINRSDADPYRLRRFNVHETRFHGPFGKLSKALFFSETSGMLGWVRGLRAA
ncbi:polysaccharide deacetylase family protein [Lysobacter sp. F6437]|uniref:polysaccharide deacetylase family protein n=1 Tax=Lysobacter sp. F6437 TaxID=3459296 RepID=UPI00403D8A33